MIKTYGLTKRYSDVLALNDLELEVAEGEIFGWIRKPFTYEQLKDCLSRPRLLAARIDTGH